MTPVGGSRHYDGGGLGPDAGWKCPSCGNENAGPIARGCAICGAGQPGRHIGRDTPPPPTPPLPEPPALGEAAHDDPFGAWRAEHPDATLEEAFTAGYVAGVRDMRRELRERPPADPTLDPESKVARTIIAALGYFADQVLRLRPDEVTTGEWCSVDEVAALIRQLTTTGEVAHA